MKRILFVDDEQAVLEALRVRLYRMRSKWDMTFRDSGVKALQDFEEQPFDVVVTDLRMPGIDGIEVLRRISERWPGTVRIVLSGIEDVELAMRLVPLTHQYLHKPCDSIELESIISRSLSLHELLNRAELRSVVGRIRQLPATPSAFAKLQSAITRDDLGTRDIAKIIGEDPAIMAKVLQLVNSAFFRLARRMTNLERAVAYLGFNAIRNLVLSAEVFSMWPRAASRAGMELEQRQLELQRVAACAQALTAGTSIADDTLLAALLQDIGYWVLAQECPDKLQAAFQMSADEGIAECEAERRMIGASHAEIGAYLLGLWGLPYPVIEAVAHHHTPLQVKHPGFSPLAALTIARHFAHDPGCGLPGAQLILGPERLEEYLTAVGAPFNWPEAERRVKRYAPMPQPQEVAV